MIDILLIWQYLKNNYHSTNDLFIIREKFVNSFNLKKYLCTFFKNIRKITLCNDLFLKFS